MASRQGTNAGPGGGRTTKAERKEQARRERIELQQRMARTRRNRRIATVAGIVAVAAVAVVIALNQGSPSTSSAASGDLQGVLTGPGPWPANTADLAQRLNALNLPPEGAALHNHAFLAIDVDGSSLPVAADIGLSGTAASPLHTHDTTGVIHIESGDASFRSTLGEFFDVWGVKLTSTCVGGYCNTGDQQLRVFVDGKAFAGDPRTIALTEHRDIVVTYGTASQVPDPLPTFDWSTFQG